MHTVEFTIGREDAHRTAAFSQLWPWLQLQVTANDHDPDPTNGQSIGVVVFSLEEALVEQADHGLKGVPLFLVYDIDTSASFSMWCYLNAAGELTNSEVEGFQQ